MEDEAIHAKLDGLKELMLSQFKNNAEQHQTMKDNLEKKASIWVESFAKGVIGTILVAFLGAITGLVLGGGTAFAAYKIITTIV